MTPAQKIKADARGFEGVAIGLAALSVLVTPVAVVAAFGGTIVWWLISLIAICISLALALYLISQVMFIRAAVEK